MYEFVYEAITPGASDNAVFDCCFDIQEYSNPDNVIKNNDAMEYASLELNSYNPKTPRTLAHQSDAGAPNIGIVSKRQSDETGSLFHNDSGLVFNLRFSNYYSFCGIMIKTRDILKNFRFTALRDDEVIYNKSITAESSTCFIEEIFENVNKFSFEILEIDKPHHFFQLLNIIFGKIELFDNSKIIKAEMEKNSSLSGRENPLSKLDITIKKDNELRLFQERQRIKVLKYGEELCTFYIEKGVTTQDSDSDIEINCYSYTRQLDYECLGGMFLQPTKISQILFDMLGQKVEMPQEIADMYATGYIPRCEVREALIYITMATGTVIDSSTETIKLVKPSDNPEFTFDKKNIIGLKKNQVSSQKINQVMLIEHNYTPATETCEAYNWYLSKTDDVIIKFNEPLHSLKAFRVTADKQKIELTAHECEFVLSNQANYCVVRNKTVDEKILIQGSKYVVSKIEHIKASPNSDVNITYSTEKIENATLKTNINNMLDSFFNYYTKNEKLTSQILGDAVDTTDTVHILNKSGNISKLKTSFNGITEIEVI